MAALMDTLQVPVPVQSPLQPVNRLVPVAVAVNVTLVPLVTLVVQVLPQSMPAGELLTLPVPAPVLETVKV